MAALSGSKTVLVTGAAGKTGRAVARALVEAGFEVVGLVRREEQRPRLERLGVRGFVEGDLLDDDVLRRAAEGVDFVYHICPNVHPQEEEIGASAIRAAKAAGVGRFVFHSVLHPITEAMPHHWAKMRVEERLLESGLDYTILQPAPYMQNVLGQWKVVARTGAYRVPYPLRTRVVMVDLGDVAAAAARVLGDAKHSGATYELCGTELLDQRQIAEQMGSVLGRETRAETVPVEEWAAGARAAGLGADRIATLEKMFEYYARHGMAGSGTVLSWLLGRRPTTFADFLERAARPRRPPGRP